MPALCLVHSHTTQDGDGCCSLHVVDEKTEVCASEVSCPDSHGLQVAEVEFKSWSVIPELGTKPCLPGLVKNGHGEGRFSVQAQGLASALPFMSCVALCKSFDTSVP